MISVPNAAPIPYNLGIEDVSTVTLPPPDDQSPQHCPKFYIWAQRGDTLPKLLVGVERDNIYGSDTFVMGGKYGNHATIFANAVNARANACMYQRLIPSDAGPKSNMTLWLDVLPTTVDLYARNSDGSIKTDALGDPEVIGTTQGYKAKWVVTSAKTHQDAQQFGIRSQMAGDQVDPATNTQSTRYPMFDFHVDSQGEYGNRLGIRMWAPLANLGQVPYSLMNSNRAFPYYMSIVEKKSANTTPVNVTTIFNEQNILVTFKPDSIDPVTTMDVYVKSRFVPAYQSTDGRYGLDPAPFSGFYAYQRNIDELQKKFFAAEVPFIDEFSDFTSDPDDFMMFNIITGVSTQNVPYHSFVFVNANNSVTWSAYTDVFADGGSDGTMNDEIFAEMVGVEMLRYRDRKDELMDTATNLETVFYDSGFPTDTKFILPSFISQRHDTFLILGTHTFGERSLTPSEEHALAVALRTRVQNYPESPYFGTPATRAMIMGCSGVIRNTVYRVPATYEIAIKFARYMGAGNGQWKSEYKPDGQPGSLVEELTELNMYFVPESVRVRFWDVGLNWIGRNDRRTFFIPAYKTVYTDDTSVLTSAITVLGCCTLNRIGEKCWRVFSGVSYLSNAQLVERVNNFVLQKSKGIFDNRFTISPDAQITDIDLARGFSWTLPIRIGAENMKTVQIMYVQANRRALLDAELGIA